MAHHGTYRAWARLCRARIQQAPSYAAHMTRGDGLQPVRVRASDDEREAVASVLAEHVAVGRLSPSEHEERLTELYASRFQDQLTHVLRELPPQSQRRRRPAIGARRLVPVVTSLAAGAAFSATAWWWSIQGGGDKELFGLGHAAPLPLAAVTSVTLIGTSEYLQRRRAQRTSH